MFRLSRSRDRKWKITWQEMKVTLFTCWNEIFVWWSNWTSGHVKSFHMIINDKYRPWRLHPDVVLPDTLDWFSDVLWKRHSFDLPFLGKKDQFTRRQINIVFIFPFWALCHVPVQFCLLSHAFKPLVVVRKSSAVLSIASTKLTVSVRSSTWSVWF